MCKYSYVKNKSMQNKKPFLIEYATKKRIGISLLYANDSNEIKYGK